MSFKIYTKTGDDGTTGLFGGGRVPKDDPRIESYGTVDELNSVLGLVRSHVLSADHDRLLGTLQDHLFILGADLATPHNPVKELRVPRVTQQEVACLELAIDELEASLPELKHFILPGGSTPGALLHLARTVCRRAERAIVALLRQEPAVGELPLVYINRLSDLLFVLARSVNHRAGIPEQIWEARVDEAPE